MLVTHEGLILVDYGPKYSRLRVPAEVVAADDGALLLCLLHDLPSATTPQTALTRSMPVKFQVFCWGWMTSHLPSFSGVTWLNCSFSMRLKLATAK